jgi:hypothetical protein
VARHIIFEAVLDPDPNEDGIDQLDKLQDRLTGELAKSGTVVVLVYQENETQVEEGDDT